jgi:hypothetical protein
MKIPPRLLRTVAVLAGVFALGVLFNRSVIPFLSHDVKVWAIQGVEARGCEGSWGGTSFRFGQPTWMTDGVYKIPCDEVSFQSETFALLCTCR